MPTFELAFGPCNVAISGPADGVPILLVHGVLVDGTLWDPIVPALATRYRVIQPDLPIGAHRTPARRRDLLSPEGIADALAELLDELGVASAVVVGNDTGGALSQILTARHPDRVDALILTSCDAFDHFPPTVLKPIKPLLAIPPVVDALAFAYRSKRLRRSWIGAGLLLTHPIDDDVIRPWFRQISTSRASRHDMAAFIRRCEPSLTHAAARSLRSFPRPVLIAWSENDPIFPPSDARRLAETIPTATLRWITGARTFSMIDQPGQLTDTIVDFLAQSSPTGHR